MLAKIDKPARLFLDMFAAIEQNSVVSFIYEPQTDQTIKSVRRIPRLLPMGLQKDRIAVKLVI